METTEHGTTYMMAGGDDGELRPWHYTQSRSVWNLTPKLCIQNPDPRTRGVGNLR